MSSLLLVGKQFAHGTGASYSDAHRSTLVDASAGLWERPAMVPRMAFLRYHRELGYARQTWSDDSVFLAVVDSGGEANRIMTLAPGESAILGRHGRCDLVIDHANVALRQLAIYVGKTSSASAPFLRVWDLHTGTPMTSENHGEVEALAADGPVFFSLGRYHIALIPLGLLPRELPVSASEAWATIPQRDVITSMAEGTRNRILPQDWRPALSTTSVRHLPSSIDLGTLEGTPVSREASIGTLVVQGHDMRRSFPLGIEHLERGIVVGRYARCLGRGFDASVSRVHLMLASVAGEIVAIDTASTVGCRVERTPFRCLGLERATKIWMGKHNHLVWKPGQARRAQL